MTTTRRRPITRVLLALVVGPVLLGSFWEAVTFYQEDDPWLAVIVLGTLAVLGVVVWLVSAERPEERWAAVEQQAAAGWTRLASAARPRERMRTAEERLFVADGSGEVVMVGPTVSPGR
jgi:hypothetical protein